MMAEAIYGWACYLIMIIILYHVMDNPPSYILWHHCFYKFEGSVDLINYSYCNLIGQVDNHIYINISSFLEGNLWYDSKQGSLNVIS